MAKKVKNCVACAHKNNTLWKAGLPALKAIPVVPKAFWRVHVDLLGIKAKIQVKIKKLFEGH